MPEKCILEAFGTGVPNGNVTVKGASKTKNGPFVVPGGIYYKTKVK